MFSGLGRAVGKLGARYAPEMSSGFKSTIGHMGVGGGAGGGLGGIGSLFDNEEGDFMQDVAVGMGMGALGGGAFRAGNGFKAGSKLRKPGQLLGGGAAVGALGAGLGHALGADFGADAPVTGVDNAVAAAGQSGTPVGLLGGEGLPSWMTNADEYYGGIGAPDVSTRSLTDWMADPELNRVADAQIIAGNAAIMREQKDLRTNMGRDLAANEALGKEYQIQAGAISRDNAADTRSIINAADANQQRIDAETDQMHEDTGAALAGNDVTRAEHAQQMDSQDARLNEARISDQELLQRLGVSGQEVLGEIAAAEAAQTKDNAVKIRTSAMDKITENRSEAKDAWRYEKPTIMGTLAQGAMDRETQQRQLGLQGYQMKMQQASQMRDTQQEYIKNQQEMQMAGAGGPDAAMLNSAATGSGIKVMGPGGQSIELPVWINSAEMAQQRGVDEATFNMWQKLIQTPEIAEQLGMAQ